MAPQELMEQIIDQGSTLEYRRNNKNDHEHPRSTKVPSTAPTDLWKTYTTEETAPCLLHPGRQHDFNMVPQMVNSANMRKTILLRFPCPHARRWGIGMYHQLHGRLHRVTQASRPEVQGNKGSRERHTLRHTQVACRRRHRTGACHGDPQSLSHSRCGDLNPVSATPHSASRRSLSQRRRNRCSHDKQEHHLVLVPVSLCSRSTQELTWD